MIQYVEIEKLIPHPKNPRQDVGDIKELSDSIKINGIMQNLTIVPINENQYHVVIGNRRLAAAKEAGLTELPCIVSNMDEKTQQSIMLLENMQRSDLTVYEQAQGFQMCLDLGMSESDLKEKTGFSKKTIKNRLTLLSLDKEKFKKGVERGATLQDYIDLQQIEDEELKDKIIDDIGTINFQYTLKREINNQKARKQVSVAVERLKEYMEKVEKFPAGYVHLDFLYDANKINNYQKPKDIETRKYAFIVSVDGLSISIYGERSNKTDTIEPKGPTVGELAVIEIKKLVTAAYETRLAFIKQIYVTVATPLVTHEQMFKYAFKCIQGTDYTDDDLYMKITGLDLEEQDVIKNPLSMKELIKLLIVLIYSTLENDHDYITVCTSIFSGVVGSYREDFKLELKELYEFLKTLGYQASEEELAIMFGTHKLYIQKEKED